MADDTAGHAQYTDDQMSQDLARGAATPVMRRAPSPVDIVLGLGAEVALRVWRAGVPVRRMAGLALAAAPGSVTIAIADRGRELCDMVEQVAQRALVSVASKAARSVLAGVDLTALVREHLDLVGIAEEIVATVDLSEIFRQTSDAVVSEAVRGVRAGGMYADDAVAGFVDRVFRRDTGAAGQTAG